MFSMKLSTEAMESLASGPSKSSPTRQSPTSTPHHLLTNNPDPPDSTHSQQAPQLPPSSSNPDLEGLTSADMASALSDDFAALSLHAPFGCTYLCGETFTSPTAWRQHEASSHRQQEIWRCSVPATHVGAVCGRTFYVTGTFATHLAGDHSIAASDVARWIENGHIHAECQTNFWCGFCRGIVVLEEGYGTRAWDERFTHLQGHFENGDSLAKGWLKLRR